MARELTEELPEQLDWWWKAHLRPRFDGLTDQEYLWEPVPHMWSVRPAGTSPVPVTVGTGPFRQDIAWPPPADPPVTTIACGSATSSSGSSGSGWRPTSAARR